MQNKAPDILKILFVDDDKDDFEIFSDIVKKTYPDALIEFLQDSGKLENVIKFPYPDIIFLDFHMPKEDGIACLKKIRSKKDLENVPVVFFSIYERQIEDARKNGANYFFIKPSSYDKMIDGVTAILKRDWKNPKVFGAFEVLGMDKM